MNPPRPTLGLHEKLLEIIVCPQCHGELLPVEAKPETVGQSEAKPETGQSATDVGGELVCQGSCGLAYPVRDGIPVLLVDEARPVAS